MLEQNRTNGIIATMKKTHYTPYLYAIYFFLGWLAQPTVEAAQECDLMFTTGIYSQFNHQLKGYLQRNLAYYPELSQTNPDDNRLTLIHYLLAPLPDQLAAQRVYHQNFLIALRQLAGRDLSQFDDRTSRLICDLNHWIFLGPNLMPPMQAFLTQNLPWPEANMAMPEATRALYRTIKSDPRFNSCTRASVNDGLLNGNLPSYLFTYDNLKQTRVIRLATQAKDLSFFETLFAPARKGIYEEFLFHIDDFRHQSKIHLYVNLMKRQGEERRKTHQLEKFEAEEPALVLITLDKNSPFYYQSGKYRKVRDAFLFQELFLWEMFRLNSPFYWSKKIEAKDWQQTCRTILKDIHRHFFDNREALSVHERRDFIEIAYLKMLDALLKKIEPDAVNISCKHCMDRGPSLFALLYAEQVLKKGHGLTQIERDRLLTQLFAAPILLHNRSSYQDRIERFISALERLQSSSL